MKLIGTSLALALGLLLVQPVWAGDASCCGPEQCLGSESCCGKCGCHGGCKRMCTLTVEKKEIKKIVFQVKCEEFCVPCPRLPCGKHGCGDGCGNGCGEACGEACGQCGAGCDHGCGKGPCCPPPKCTTAKCRKILVPVEKTETICVYKCVPCYSCGQCEASGACSVDPIPVPAPTTAPAPTPAGKVPVAPAPPAHKQAYRLPPVPESMLVNDRK